MGWSIINVTLKGPKTNASEKEFIDEILRDGWEPYSTAGMADGRLTLSFRRQTSGKEAAIVEEYPPPGQYL